MLIVKHDRPILIVVAWLRAMWSTHITSASKWNPYPHDRDYAIEMWSYRCYVTGETPNLWAGWYEREKDMRGRHDQAFRILEQRDPWTKPHWKVLSGRGGLGEVLLRGGSKEWRIFGFIQRHEGPRREFLVCGIGYHKDRVYTPRTIMDICEERMGEIKSDGSKAEICGRPGFPKGVP
jgi:hypothetical protein